MKIEIAKPMDFTPERVAEEIKEQIMSNPFILDYRFERSVTPNEVPTIIITLELLVGKKVD